MSMDTIVKRLFWVASSKKDLKALPDEVQNVFGYALHAFQKKSSSGIATRKEDMEFIKQRLKLARQHYEQEFGK
jgi:phage-related protein